MDTTKATWICSDCGGTRLQYRTAAWFCMQTDSHLEAIPEAEREFYCEDCHTTQRPALAPVATPEQFFTGDRVVLRRTVGRFPYCIIAKGATGTVDVVEGEGSEKKLYLSVTMDAITIGLEEWDNQLIWSGWMEGDAESLPFDIALLLPCEECGTEVEVGDHCGHRCLDRFLCPDCCSINSD